MKKFGLLAASLFLAGCYHTPKTTTLPVVPTSAPQEAMADNTFALTQLNKSGQNGTAKLEETAGQTTVTLTLTPDAGVTVADPEPAHIHLGSCITPGEVKYPLNDVVDGSSVTTIDADLATLKALGNISINVHKSATDIATYVACGDINLP